MNEHMKSWPVIGRASANGLSFTLGSQPLDFDGFIPANILPQPQRLHEGVDDDEDEGDEKVEEKPDVNHLKVGGVRQAVIHLDIRYQ